ncbi:MAG: type II secretion system protein M [Neomegalonema sp.]|nr:type II secretion system protein M [Neomegalonema sp.]
MIRKGTPVSRIAAVSLALGPFILFGGVFTVWAISSWSSAGDRIRAAEKALHRIEAQRSQSELYEPLGKSWSAYSISSTSGLMQEKDAKSAGQALITRVEGLLKRAKGGAGVVNIIAASQVKPGLEIIRAEARGWLPETALPAFFETLESQEPFLFVEALELRRGDDASAKETVAVTVRVAAFRLTGAPK